MARDPQHRRLTRAEEDVLLDITPRRFRNTDAIVRFTKRVMESDWYTGPDEVIIEYRPGAHYADSLVWKGVGYVRLPFWGWNEMTVLHELAHLCTWRGQHHGPAFARRLLEAQERFAPRATYEAYVEAYERRGVRTR